MSDVGTYITSEKFKEFCRCLNVHHIVLLSYNHQSNGGAGACILFTEDTIKNAMTLKLMYVKHLHIYSTPIGPMLLIPVALLFNRPVKGILPKLNP